MADNNSFDLFILILRIALVFLLYFFLYMVVRTISRELNASRYRRMPSPMPEQVYPPETYDRVPANRSDAYGQVVVTEAGSATTVRPGMVFALGPISPIGRRSNNAIVLDDEFVSSEHSLLAWRDGRWWLSDVASTNGTFLNGQRVTRPVEVNWGDQIGIGGVRLRLEP
ncbi:MAG TPA: FHA domain-containing protein [Chloroflexia bacterium]|nr:FHA domain-containing protein [Chloroflexia bacterium]